MNKTLTRFRNEPFGLFIDLAQNGRIGVNPRSGEILLDEGDGPDCYHGAVIAPGDFRLFSLGGTGEEAGAMSLHFGENDVHPLGVAPDAGVARQWIQSAERAIRAHQDVASTNPSQRVQLKARGGRSLPGPLARERGRPARLRRLPAAVVPG